MPTNLVRILLLLALASLALASCKNDDKDDEPDPVAGEVFLKSQIITWTVGGGHHGEHGSEPFVHTDTLDFSYDGQQRMTLAGNMQFLYNSDGTLSKTVEGVDTVSYLYNSGLLSTVITNCGYYIGGNFIDTTRFYYTDGTLSFIESSHEKTHTDLTFNQDNLLQTKFVRSTDPYSVETDSLFYKWENGNLVKLSTRAGYPYVSYLYEREYVYDNHPSYTSTIHFPDEYLLVQEITQFYGKYPFFYYDLIPWRYNSRNNPVEYIETTTYQTMTRQATLEYNEQGYPVKLKTNIFEMILKY